MKKSKIYYARTYRRLRWAPLKSAFYLLLFVLPFLILVVLNLYNITAFICAYGSDLLNSILHTSAARITSTEFSVLGTVEYISISAPMPDVWPTFLNMVITLLIFCILGLGKWRGNPLAIFLMLSAFVHLVNCVFFLFGAGEFPYTAAEFSDLYMKQQIGIWLTFIILSGLVTSFVGNRGYLYKILTFLVTMCYSFAFGGIRYILFLYFLHRFSVLYMALMYFVLGPMFDFLYFVSIYAVFANKMVKLYENGSGKEDWEWL